MRTPVRVAVRGEPCSASSDRRGVPGRPGRRTVTASSLRRSTHADDPLEHFSALGADEPLGRLRMQIRQRGVYNVASAGTRNHWRRAIHSSGPRLVNGSDTSRLTWAGPVKLNG